jgi:hypothetical protein
MNKIVRIPSKLYAELFLKGGDKLISVYTILKSSRDGEVKYYSYTSRNNKKLSGFNLLRNKTSLTLHTIEKYVPMLIELGLCFIDKNGDFVLLGNDKLKDKYNTKLVPLKVGKNLTDTSYNVYLVRGFSMEKSQTKQINKKLTQREQIAQISNPKTLADYKAAKRFVKIHGEKGVEVIEKTVLSLQGFGVLKHSEKNEIRDIKSSGAYYKRKLIEKGLITTKREFKRIEKMSYSEFLNRKEFGELDRKNLYKNGWLVEETVSSFSTSFIKDKVINKPSKEQKETVIFKLKDTCSNYRRKEYLQFDMIDFWVNSKCVL